MRIARLYLPHPLQAGARIALEQESAHYLRTVLRLRQGAKLSVFNGRGGEFSAWVAQLNRKFVILEIGDWLDREAESAIRVELGLGLSRGERMDFAIQKAVELGVSSLTPLVTERCVVQLKGDRKDQKLKHWRKIVQNACEQSGRNVPPPIAEPMELNRWLAGQSGLKLFLDPYSDKALNQLAPQNGRISLLSGPEGGFSDQEREMARAAGFIPIALGPRILRTETAALAALAAIQTLWGDFKM